MLLFSIVIKSGHFYVARVAQYLNFKVYNSCLQVQMAIDGYSSHNKE